MERPLTERSRLSVPATVRANDASWPIAPILPSAIQGMEESNSFRKSTGDRDTSKCASPDWRRDRRQASAPSKRCAAERAAQREYAYRIKSRSGAVYPAMIQNWTASFLRASTGSAHVEHGRLFRMLQRGPSDMCGNDNERLKSRARLFHSRSHDISSYLSYLPRASLVKHKSYKRFEASDVLPLSLVKLLTILMGASRGRSWPQAPDERAR
ncbi:hypothetical protein OKW33_003360 [Paraburkholderia atlantica]